MLTSQCVNSLQGASRGLHFITENLPRQHSDSDLSWRTEGRLDQLHVRATGVNDQHSGGRQMNGADKPLAHLTLFESCVSTIQAWRSEQWVQETRTHAAVWIIWIGLKIDRVTVKFATAPRAKVNAPSVSAIASSTEAEEQRVQQIDELSPSDIFLSKSKPTLWAPLIYCNYYNLSPSLLYSLSHISSLII